MPSIHSLSNDVYRALAREADHNTALYAASLALADAIVAQASTPVASKADEVKPKPKAKKKGTIRPTAAKLRGYKSAALSHLATADGSIHVFWSEVYKDEALSHQLAKVVAAAVWVSRNSGSFTNEEIAAATNTPAFIDRAKNHKPVHDAYIRAITRTMWELKVADRGYVVGSNRLRFNW